MNNQVKIFLGAWSLGMALGAAAQTPPSQPAAVGPPTPPSAAAAQLNYRSAFADYQPYQDIEPGDWRAANDMVGKASDGHAGHGMTMASPPMPAAPSDPHPGHRMGGTQQ